MTSSNSLAIERIGVRWYMILDIFAAHITRLDGKNLKVMIPYPNPLIEETWFNRLELRSTCFSRLS